MDIKHQYVLLTGASGGIGEQIARALAARGAWLILVGRDSKKLKCYANHYPQQKSTPF